VLYSIYEIRLCRHNLEGIQNLLLAFMVHNESYRRINAQYKALGVALLHSIVILLKQLLFQSFDTFTEPYCWGASACPSCDWLKGKNIRRQVTLHLQFLLIQCCWSFRLNVSNHTETAIVTNREAPVPYYYYHSINAK
jgi:hypothetical protein